MNPRDDHRPPQGGDLSVCISCGAFLMFLPNLRLVMLPQETFDGLPAINRGQMLQLREQIYAVKRTFNRN
jgi:hypothetical protein